MNNMYAFDLGTNNILNADTKGDKKKRKIKKWRNDRIMWNIFLF